MKEVIVGLRVNPTTKKVAPIGATRIHVEPGDTVRFMSPDGATTVSFSEPSPFEPQRELVGDTAHTVTGRKGVYRYKCGVQTPGGSFGFPDKPDDSQGGEVEIIRNP